MISDISKNHGTWCIMKNITMLIFRPIKWTSYKIPFICSSICLLVWCFSAKLLAEAFCLTLGYHLTYKVMKRSFLKKSHSVVLGQKAPARARNLFFKFFGELKHDIILFAWSCSTIKAWNRPKQLFFCLFFVNLLFWCCCFFYFFCLSFFVFFWGGVVLIFCIESS